jgi:hypothetical protein
MTRSCQGLAALVALITCGAVPTAPAAAQAPTPAPVARAAAIELTAWKPRPFAEVVLDSPDLAACFVRAPGWWAESAEPAELPTATDVARYLGDDLAGILGSDVPSTVAITVASTAEVQPAAIAHGNVVLVLLPTTPRTTAAQLSRVVAAALLAPTLRPATPEEEVSEALFAFAESLANAGSLSLASLPAELRPVSDWLEAKDVSAAIAAIARESFDTESSWEMRRARITRFGQEGGASPSLAHAAAYLVEAFGDAGVARRRPFELLRAWQADKAGKFPTMPAPLKHALAEPRTAGLPKEPTAAEIENRALRAFQRQLANGRVPAEAPAAPLPLADRLLAAALERAQGGGNPCRWITADVPAPLRTGCRAEGEKPGVVYARPLPLGSDVVARTPTGVEGVLLRWPRWVLFPQLVPDTGELLFVDELGIWSVALDEAAAPRLIAPGGFRHLIVSPDGERSAAARWPAGEVVMLESGGLRTVAANGRGGLTWVENDVLLASDGERLALIAADGEVAPWPVTLPCTRALFSAGGIFATVTQPCEAGIVRLSPADGSVSRLVTVREGPFGLVVVPDGSIVFGGPDGLWRFAGGERAERIGAGVTPGRG